MMVAGTILLLAAFGANGPRFESGLLVYCVGLLFMSTLLWWEATWRPADVLPAWTSPPALIAAWALTWIYAPAAVAFLDRELLDDLTAARGGETVLLTGLPLACAGLGLLSISYHLTTLALGRRARIVLQVQRLPSLRRVVLLYLASAAARALRLATLGVAFGADLASWGPLQSVDQWIGYVEDLRFLALALLVGHVVLRRTGHWWLAITLIFEFVSGVSSGFLTPVILAVVLCVVTAAAVDRLRRRYFAAMAAAALVMSTFAPVIAAIREDRLGAVGTTDLVHVSDVLTAPGRYWLDGISAGAGVYRKFFGRQTEVASATGLVVMFTPAVLPYEGLERFLTLPAGLIPRLFWPDKPSLSRGVWFSSTFRGLPEHTTSYSAMTIFSEGYLFYGWTGTVLAMLIAGGLLAVVRRRLDNPRLALVYLALVPTILQIEPELSSYLTTLVQRSLVFVVVFILLSHTRVSSLRERP
jgi:hypothetical protein